MRTKIIIELQLRYEIEKVKLRYDDVNVNVGAHHIVGLDL